VKQIAAQIKAGHLSAQDHIADTIAKIERHNSSLGAFTDFCFDRARRRAEEIDGAMAGGQDPGTLAGVSFAVKNLFDIKGFATRAGSKINCDHAPAERDAELIARLERAGAILVGGLNMGEYAYDFTGENAHDGPSRNPHDLARMTGGSSGGSGAAIAGGLVPLALGSDTNGSIRVPSALCGVFGLKPTYGRLPRTGTFPFCDSLDHVGALARHVDDLIVSFEIMQGFDKADHGCVDRPTITASDVDVIDPSRLRIGVLDGYFQQGSTQAAQAAVATIAQALNCRQTATLESATLGRAAAFLVTAAEGGALHTQRLRERMGDFDPDTRDRFFAGALIPAQWLIKAQRVRRWHYECAMKLFDQFDILLAPATPCSAPLLGTKELDLGDRIVPLRANLGLYTQPISCIGLPVVTVPIHQDQAMPLGVQIISAPWREDHALAIAGHLEKLGIAQAPIAKGFG
jgi:aspartyl-tRNA(Asn)/glutamyl-tRNA(Gln) amidotransferase subunit A